MFPHHFPICHSIHHHQYQCLTMAWIMPNCTTVSSHHCPYADWSHPVYITGCTCLSPSDYTHVIIDKMCCNPEFIFMVLTYIFSVANICNCFIAQDNGASMRFTSHLGFIHTGVLRQFPKPLVIYSMTVNEWMNNRIRQHVIKRYKK